MSQPIDRRAVLRGASAGLLLGGAMTLFGNKAMAGPLPGGGNPAPYNGKSKVLRIFLRGGNDGLNTIIPIGDPEYSSDPTLRPDIQIFPGQAIDLGNNFAYAHPALEPVFGQLAPQHMRDGVAAVHRVGYHNHNRSHFESMLNMETTIHTEDLGGSIIASVNDGHVPRAAQVLGWGDGVKPGAAISVSTGLQTTFTGKADVYTPATLAEIEEYKAESGPSTQADYDKLLGVANGTALTAAYQPANPPKAHWDPDARATGSALLATLGLVGSVPPPSPTTWPGTTIPRYPQPGSDLSGTGLQPAGRLWDFAQKTRDAMRLLEQPWCHITGVQLGGFDTHGQQGGAAQGGEHFQLLRTLAHMMRSIYHDAVDMGIWNDLVVIVVSEFGRTSEQNASKGTDHGNAGVSFLMGGRVNGGVHNCDAVSWVPVNSGSTSVIHEFPIGAGPGIPTYPGRITDYRAIEMEILVKLFGITNSTTLDGIIWDYRNQVGDPLPGFIT